MKHKERSWIERALREGALWLCLAAGLLMFVALLSHVPEAAEAGLSGSNMIGAAGAAFAVFAFLLAGQASYLFPAAVMGFSAWYLAPAKARQDWSWPDAGVRAGGWLLVVVCGCGLLQMSARGSIGGGIVGLWLADALDPALGNFGGIVILLALWMTGFTLLTGLSWLALAQATGRLTLRCGQWLWERGRMLAPEKRRRSPRRKATPVRPVAGKRAPIARKDESQVAEKHPDSRLEIGPDKLDSVGLPPLSLLSDPPLNTARESDQFLREQAGRLEEKLKEFGVGASVTAVSPGPVVTLFAVQPAAGVRASRISSLASDLARSLKAFSVRVVESMPGKSTVGLEIANRERALVTLGEILRSQAYAQDQSTLTLGLGMDIAGDPVVADLEKMPHLLVAGATGSGKSVAINAMVLSLLYKSTPETVRLIMIDPKMLELSVYEGIPHLLCPVVTDVNEAANALRWCVAEMDRRYRLMSWIKTRSLEGFNNRVQVARDAGEPLFGPPVGEGEGEEQGPELEPLPRIVVVIDELADLMMVVGKKLETLIARLTQKARAAGVHLIVATQRPSVDVITGLIKANIPARIGFRVASQVDSRTILDQVGAETLLGKGDMLYLPAGSGDLLRVHGAFVEDAEVLKVVEVLKRSGGPSYDDQVTQGPVEGQEAEAGAADGDGEMDELYAQAREIVIETGRASISYVQRRLRVGYNRAARLIEELERAGVVSEPDGRGERRVVGGNPE